MTFQPLAAVFGLGLITALATGLGALPFAFVRSVSGRTIAWANALASGLMLGASLGLAIEGTRHGGAQTLVGGALGVLFILLTQRALEGRDIRFGSARGPSAREMAVIVIVMTAHSAAEGIAVGSAFAGGRTLAVVVTAAIALHNVPEGLAITAVLRPRGTTVVRCVGWSIFSSLPQPILAVPAFLFVDAVRPALPYAMGFAAGAMVFMVFEELLPEAYEEGSRARVGLLTSLALVAMILFQSYLG
jgi:ZIP family zinc transporter